MGSKFEPLWRVPSGHGCQQAGYGGCGQLSLTMGGNKYYPVTHMLGYRCLFQPMAAPCGQGMHRRAQGDVGSRNACRASGLPPTHAQG